MPMPIDKHAHASIIVTCKGRLHHLRETLPLMLRQAPEIPFEVVVVDYGCPQGTFDWLRSLDYCKVLAVRVLDKAYPFNQSRARNCGARFARGNIFAFMDADMRPHHTWLATAVEPLLAKAAGLCIVKPAVPNTVGTCVVTRELYYQVRGYDEGFQGWGRDDSDFYKRCAPYSTIAKYPASLLRPIRHSNEERTRYYEQSLHKSDARNLAYVAKRNGIINELGFGRGRFLLYRGKGSNLPLFQSAERCRVVRQTRVPRGVRLAIASALRDKCAKYRV
jgi:glycosyltransferase involved in cell wall biosynthesis